MKKRILRALPWIMVAAAYVLTIGFFAYCGSHNMSGDDGSEILHAALVNRDGGWIHTENWVYSTELRVISPTPLYQIGLKLMPTWHAARVFAQAVSLALVLVSFLYMAHELGMKKAAPYLAAVLMLPFNDVYDYVVAYGLHYSVHLILSFLILGLVFRFGQKEKKRGWLTLLLLLGLGLWSGLGGVRMLMMIIAPLMGASALMALMEMKRHDTFRASLNTPAVRMAGASALCFGATGVGYVAGLAMFKEKYTYFSYTDIGMERFKMSDLINQLSSMLYDLGYVEGVSLMSIRGMNNLLCVVIFMALGVAVWRMLSRFEKIAPAHRLLTMTAVLAIIVGMLCNIMLAQLLTRYFLVGTVLLFVVLALALEVEPCRNALLRTLALLAMTGCCAFGAQCIMRYDYKLGDVNYEMAADWLVENGYTQGYATYWNANILSAASDGKLDMWVLSDSTHGLYAGEWRTMGMQRILQEKHKLTEDPEGKVFLLVTEAEQAEGSPLLDPAHYVDMVAWSYHVYEYDSAAQMRELIANAQAEN